MPCLRVGCPHWHVFLPWFLESRACCELCTLDVDHKMNPDVHRTFDSSLFRGQQAWQWQSWQCSWRSSGELSGRFFRQNSTFLCAVPSNCSEFFVRMFIWTFAIPSLFGPWFMLLCFRTEFSLKAFSGVVLSHLPSKASLANLCQFTPAPPWLSQF